MFYKFLSIFPLLIAASSTYSALIDRDNGLIYDDVLDITWLQDANYAQTNGLAPDGKMTKSQAKDLAENFEFTSSDGSISAINWRLPSVLNDQVGYTLESELGSLLYDSLGNTPGSGLSSSFFGPDNDFIFSFSNLQPTGFYWFNEQPEADKSFIIWSGTGWLGKGKNTWTGYVWLVHDGDIGNNSITTEVPVPASIYFFVSAILALVSKRNV